MAELLGTVLIGLASGVLSGLFGIGGGIVTMPALRLLLGAPALVAIGTPLVAIIPGAITGSITFVRRGVADVRTGVTAGAAGALLAVAGAFTSDFLGGTVVLVFASALLFYFAISMAWTAAREERPRGDADGEKGCTDAGQLTAAEADASDELDVVAGSRNETAEKPLLVALAIGAFAGFNSGLMGVGGGFILVPLFSRLLGFSQKRAVATSLISIMILAIPGVATHAMLGHIDWRAGAGLVLGVVPGAWVGARIALRSSDRALRFAFAGMLAFTGVWLAVTELGLI